MERSLRIPSSLNSARRTVLHRSSTPITPQQNGLVEQKNQVIQEMVRTMIHCKNLATHFQGEAINTACHLINRIYLRPSTNKTPYQGWKGKKPIVKYFHVFGSKCFILRDRENLKNFVIKTNEESWVTLALARLIGCTTREHKQQKQLSTKHPTLVIYLKLSLKRWKKL